MDERLGLQSVLGMFRRNYAENHRPGEDDDGDIREADWRTIRSEEARSLRMAREEDEREAALEEERLRRLAAKKRKPG